MSRRAAMAGAVSVLAASLGLAACSDDPKPETVRILTPQTDTGLRDLFDGARGLVVSGQSLNVALLKPFYARHGYALVWPTRRTQADSLLAAVLRAPDQGIDPELFHVSLLQHASTLSPLERDLLLSNAVLSYADALARGVIPVERRRSDQILTPEPIDVAAVVGDAIDTPDPAAAIEALAPTTPTYLALRHALHEPHTGKSAAGRLRTIEVNLERQRWLPRRLPADRAWVNAADERLVLYHAGRPVFSTRVVVGEDITANQSPEFEAAIDASFYNPPWVVPANIARAEILPKAARDPTYLKRNGMIVLANDEVEQLPGPQAGLGLIMFDMPNRFDVYLHDTPDRSIFNRDDRRLSHGCIRVQNPRQFAALLMDLPLTAIDRGIAAGNTTRNNLATPVPVFVVYQTAFVDTDGRLQFRPDFYNRDMAIWRAMQPPPAHPLAAIRRPAPSTPPRRHGRRA